MKVCYIDEAGCTGVLPALTSSIQPVFVTGALIVDQAHIEPMTRAFLEIKRKYCPREAAMLRHALDSILIEIKGSELRKQIRESSRNPKRRALRILDEVVSLWEKANAQIVGRILIKGLGLPMKSSAIYTSSIQDIANRFNACVAESGDFGLMIVDGRKKQQDINVSHSIFTAKFKSSGDEYRRLLEMPLFGDSVNHAGLQMADILCSALLFPLAAGT